MKTCRPFVPRWRAALILLAAGAWGAVLGVADTPARRALTATDIIEMKDLAEPDIKDLVYLPAQFAFSPDQGFFAYVTRQGNVGRNRRDYELIVTRAEDVRSFLRDPDPRAPRPRGTVLAAESTSDPFLFEHAIRHLRWNGDHELLYLADHADEPTQVFLSDVRTGARRRLTSHAHPVLSFSYEPNSQRVVYVVREPYRDPEDGKTSFVVGNRSLTQTLYPENELLRFPRYRVFLDGPGAGDRRGPVGEAFYSSSSASDIWISPQGRYAITRRPVADHDRVLRWMADYTAFGPDAHRLRYGSGDGSRPDEYFTSAMDLQPLHQLVLLDLEKGAVTPLFDAPDGSTLSTGHVVEVRWLADGERAILANVLLPLDGVDETERGRRSAGALVVEWNAGTGRATPIASLGDAAAAERPRRQFTGLSLSPEQTVELKFGGTSERYARRDNAWERVTAAEQVRDAGAAALEISVRQDLNTPPDLFARDGDLGKVITEFNPQFHELAFGRVDVINWTDSAGKKWEAGLMHPPGIALGRRTSLVIQTYGFNPKVFPIDHSARYSSAFAAQALVNRGMRVLLLPRAPSGGMDWAGHVANQRGIEGAIDQLDGQGLIDRSRVGIIGFSGTGVIVQHLLTYSEYPIVAATIADSWNFTLFGYISYLYGFLAPGMLGAEGLVGAKPWGDDLAHWVERDPSLHTDRIRAAVRLEQYNRYVLPYWDIYALMRRQGKAAEMVVFPAGMHQLRRPLDRLDSLEGNVDWFDFWLDGEEDPDPRKSAQYERWRDLRRRHQAALAAPRPPAPGGAPSNPSGD